MFLEPTFHPQGASYSKMTASAPAGTFTLQVARSWMGQWINDVLLLWISSLRRFPRYPIQSTAIFICKAGWEVYIFIIVIITPRKTEVHNVEGGDNGREAISSLSHKCSPQGLILFPNDKFPTCMKGHYKVAEAHAIKPTALGFPYEALYDLALIPLPSHTSYPSSHLAVSAHQSKLPEVPCTVCLHALNLFLFAQPRYHLLETPWSTRVR